MDLRWLCMQSSSHIALCQRHWTVRIAGLIQANVFLEWSRFQYRSGKVCNLTSWAVVGPWNPKVCAFLIKKKKNS